MTKDIVLLDLFSGIGGFNLGLRQAGFNIVKDYYSEIDKHAIAIYKQQFKDSEYVGSVTSLDGRSITRPNIITFGSPCQDFSLAGKRSGLGGERSSLVGEAIRLIAECRPDVFVWENVKGVFSSNNRRDFWAVIQAFTNIGGYRLEWQLLNTKWFLPQNRERVYLVGHLTENGRDWRGVFPFSEDDFGFIERTAKTAINTLSGGGHSGGMHSGMTLVKYGTSQDQKLSPLNGNSQTLNSGHYNVAKVAISTHQPRCGDPSRGGTGALESTKHCFTLDSMPHYVNNIRRLTEIECERLQGYPDNWTKHGNYGGVIKQVSKTQRYKALGNAVTVAVVKEIGKRLLNKTK